MIIYSFSIDKRKSKKLSPSDNWEKILEKIAFGRLSYRIDDVEFGHPSCDILAFVFNLLWALEEVVFADRDTVFGHAESWPNIHLVRNGPYLTLKWMVGNKLDRSASAPILDICRSAYKLADEVFEELFDSHDDLKQRKSLFNSSFPLAREIRYSYLKRSGAPMDEW